MLDLQRQEAIKSALWHACEVFRGNGVVSTNMDLMLAMLLLKYISDLGRNDSSPDEKQGYGSIFVVPRGWDYYALHAASHEPGNGQRIDHALREVEKANSALHGAFQSISVDATTALGSSELKDRVLAQLLDSFRAEALDFRVGGDLAAEAVAFACDSLIRQFAAASGRLGGEFFTPPEISQLMARLMRPENGNSISDPCCGSGTLLITCNQLARQRPDHRGCALYGQEKNGSTWAMAKMNMVLHGELETHIEWGDTLRNPQLLTRDGRLQQFDIVVSSPPFNLRDWGHEDAERDVHHRYRRGVPPRTAGDYAFISHMVETLKPETGRMAVVVSLGVLFRGAAEHQIRKRLLEENLIDAVIALPSKMFPHTGIPVALMVLRKNKADTSVLFIDASRDYLHGKIHNTLREEDLTRIESTYQARQDAYRYARLVGQAEIFANDCNLNVARYIDTTEDDDVIDLCALRSEREQLRAELEGLEGKLAALLKEVE